MLNKDQQDKLLTHMQSLKQGEVKEFASYSAEEAQYIHFAISMQKGRMFECNGSAELPETITKFRRMPDLIKELIVNK